MGGFCGFSNIQHFRQWNILQQRINHFTTFFCRGISCCLTLVMLGEVVTLLFYLHKPLVGESRTITYLSLISSVCHWWVYKKKLWMVEEQGRERPFITMNWARYSNQISDQNRKSVSCAWLSRARALKFISLSDIQLLQNNASFSSCSLPRQTQPHNWSHFSVWRINTNLSSILRQVLVPFFRCCAKHHVF